MAFRTVSRSLSTGSLDGWVDAAPSVRNRKPSIDSMSSWCVADVSDPAEDWTLAQEGGSPSAPSLLEAPQGPSLAPSERGSRRSSLASWDDALVFEPGYASDSSWAGMPPGGMISGRSSRRASCVGSVDGGFESYSDGEAEGDEMRNRKYGIPSQFSEITPREEGAWRVDNMPSLDAQVNSCGSLNQEWECTRCSFLNHELLPTCEMCESSKGEQMFVFANRSEADQSVPRFRPSFADVARASSKPIAISPKRNARRAQKPKLSLPRVRPYTGLTVAKKCERTLSASFTPSLGPKGSRSKSTSRSSGSVRSAKDKYYLPAIEGIPEEEEDSDDDEAPMIFPLDQDLYHHAGDSEEEMLQTLEIEEPDANTTFPEEESDC